ncbi:hypothetical protein BGZ52_006486 [Haplosporangium bisporale]|nr:hypothetical protein BGZ52_006486 [Haplosporangium bisporale]
MGHAESQSLFSLPPQDLRPHIKEVHYIEPNAVNTSTTYSTKTTTMTAVRLPALADNKNDQLDEALHSDVGVNQASNHFGINGQENDNGDYGQADEDHLSLSSLSVSDSEATPHITRVCRLDPCRDRDKYKSAEDHFMAMWTKDNATEVKVESVLEVFSNQQTKFDAYKAAIASRQPGCAEQVLYHGTNSCQGQYHYNLQDGCINNDVLQQLCYKTDCATCGILAYGFDLTRSGQGSRDRGARVWQRFGHGIYFSPNSSKCHFYSKTGNTGYHPTTKKNFGTMIVAKVLLGKPYHPPYAGKAEEAWTAPPAGHDSVVALPGHGIVIYEENVVYKPEACLPTAVITYSFTSTTEYN